MQYDRVRSLFGDDFVKIQNAKVLLLGVGGVGGVCLDCLYRSGFKDITIVDFDIFDETNQNRQLYSENYLGEVKVNALKKHYKNINVIKCQVTPSWIDEFDFESYDVVLDAIDDVKSKVALAKKCHKKLISSLGSAKRYDASQVKVDTIWNSYGDKFGAKIRYELRKAGFKKKYKVIFSSEEAKVKNSGSFMGVTATFGLFMCSEIIKKVIDV